METQTQLYVGLQEFTAVYMPARNLSPRTRTEYANDVKDLISFLTREGVESWPQVGLTDLNKYLAELDRRKLKPSSRRRKTYSIKIFFSFLEQSGRVDTNQANQLIPPKVPKREPRFLSKTEYQALLAQITNSRDSAIVELFLQTGMRLSELVGLDMTDVQLPKRVGKNPDDVGLVRVDRKGSDIEYLPLNWKACEALNAWIKERERPSGRKNAITSALFLTKYGKRPSRRAIQLMLKKYLNRAGIKVASVHTLRHTMATHYLAKGGDLRSIQAMLGHHSLVTTEMYVGLAKKAQRKMVQELAL